MSSKSPFAIQKTLIGIGGEPKSVKRLRSGDLLIETLSALQTKSFLLAKTFLNSSVTISPHKTLNSCRGVISEPDLLTTPEAEMLEGFSNQGVIQLHSADSKLCSKWKIEKQIQEIKTNKNVSYFEARKLIVPQSNQTYAQAFKPSNISTTTQTDPNITNIICPPLQCLKPVSSKNPKPSTSSAVSTVSTSFSSTQENLLPSPSTIIPTIQSESLLKIQIPTTTTTTSPGNNLNIPVSSLEAETPFSYILINLMRFQLKPYQSLSLLHPIYIYSEHSNAAEIPQFVKRNSRNRRKRPKVQKPEIEIKMAPHRPRKAAPIEYATEEEDMIIYDAEEEELQPDPTVKFALKENPINYPKGY
ncbi:putative RNA-directed DNA polymerase from transposon BS [Trichonephila clavipes]|nr:putative RNA-directed DNA polymerase from transposon BS [Trichonephila clavipes]